MAGSSGIKVYLSGLRVETLTLFAALHHDTVCYPKLYEDDVGSVGGKGGTVNIDGLNRYPGPYSDIRDPDFIIILAESAVYNRVQ